MSQIKLDARLEQDCHVLGSLQRTCLLLHRNAGIAWFILVPETDCTEVVDLPAEQQAKLHDDINELSRFIRTHFDVDKLNIASIGNVVPQMHVHVIGRNRSDYCWPNPVWGTHSDDVYSDEEIGSIRKLLLASIEDFVAAG